MICFYHSADLDGHCSGALIKMKYPECELYGINYGDEFPWDKVENQHVIMVDFCLQPFEDMLKLKEKANALIWIDHHKSVIDESKKYPVIEGFRKNGRAACELVWIYYNISLSDIPTFVYLLGRYDVWDHSDPRTLPFQWGMKQYDTDPSRDSVMEFWNLLFDVELINRIIEDGSIILKYVKSEDEKYVKALSFETELDGYKAIAVNKMFTNSQLFDSVWDNTKYDIMITFGWKKGSWTISLYTDKEGVDVSKIAKKHGGGGHKQAAGFQCKTMPFHR